MTIHNETDLLGLTRAEKKLAYWTELEFNGTTTVTSADDGIVYEVSERIQYWAKQVVKYKNRIEKHIEEFNKIKDPIGLIQWVASIVETIKAILQSLNIKI